VIEGLSGRTRVLALLGDPVRHSLSPSFQNAGLRAAALDAVYVALRCSAADLPTMMLGLARAGGGGNITVPHKEIAAVSVERPTQAVLATGACNTFWLEDGRVCGDNTDVTGFAAAARKLLGGSARGSRVLLIGAGGAASAAVEALLQEGAGEITILNRSPERATALRDRYTRSGSLALRLASDSSRLAGETFDLAVNATSLGLNASDPLPLHPGEGIQVGAALDLVYSPHETRWVREMRASGCPGSDGLEMLLQQGAAAFQRWWGGMEAPIEAMRSALPPR
jgi:shikimate dehydrogenase